jgi:hypothetical protein
MVMMKVHSKYYSKTKLNIEKKTEKTIAVIDTKNDYT